MSVTTLATVQDELARLQRELADVSGQIGNVARMEAYAYDEKQLAEYGALLAVLESQKDSLKNQIAFLKDELQ